MGRRKSVRELEKQLLYAKNLAAYTPPDREQGAATQRRPKLAVTYEVTSPLAGTGVKFTLQASKEGVLFFGKTTLGLEDPATNPGAPRGFRPNQMRAMVADATPVLVKADGSKRPYIRYGKGTKGSNAQYNYTAPVSAATADALDTKVKAAVTAAKTKVGGAFGRIWFEGERYPFNASGE
jgi:hypothetical protein